MNIALIQDILVILLAIIFCYSFELLFLVVICHTQPLLVLSPCLFCPPFAPLSFGLEPAAVHPKGSS